MKINEGAPTMTVVVKGNPRYDTSFFVEVKVYALFDTVTIDINSSENVDHIEFIRYSGLEKPSGAFLRLLNLILPLLTLRQREVLLGVLGLSELTEEELTGLRTEEPAVSPETEHIAT
jgi:hypothetical protein